MSNQGSALRVGDDRQDDVAFASVVERLRRDRYSVTPASGIGPLLARYGLADWDGYARSWDDLAPDRFMADGGTDRRRRFACFSTEEGGFRLQPGRTHYQTRDNNPLNGGIARVFEPVRPDIVDHPANRAVLALCDALFTAATPPERRPRAWHVELHQFRIEARPGVAGRPTPEGMHRDGVDWVLVLLVRRENVAGGVSTIADDDRRPLRDVTLAEPLDACLFDDRGVLHGVSPVRPVDPSRPAWRDALVVTFRGAPRDPRAVA